MENFTTSNAPYHLGSVTLQQQVTTIYIHTYISPPPHRSERCVRLSCQQPKETMAVVIFYGYRKVNIEKTSLVGALLCRKLSHYAPKA